MRNAVWSSGGGGSSYVRADQEGRFPRARTEGDEEEEEEGGDVDEAEDDAEDVEGGSAVAVLQAEQRVVEEQGSDEEEGHPAVLEARQLGAGAAQEAQVHGQHDGGDAGKGVLEACDGRIGG